MKVNIMKILSIIMIVFVLALIVGCQKTEEPSTSETTTTIATTTTVPAEADMGLNDVDVVDDENLDIDLNELDY